MKRKMKLINKTHCFWLLVFWIGEISPQEQFYISTNGDTHNSHHKSSSYDLSSVISLKNKNSKEVLDSLICSRSTENRIKLTYYYNDDLSLYYYTFADWINGKWVYSEKRTNTYNSNRNLESVLWEWFNPSLEEWFKVAKEVYNYDSLGNMIYYLHQYFNGQFFENSFKYEKNYDTKNNLISIINYDWEDNIWIKRTKSFYTYTKENLIDTAIFQIWTNNQWINNRLNIFKYDEKFNIDTNLVKRWGENNWLNHGKGSYEYDVNNNRLLENWEIANYNNWENWFRIFYDYNENNNLIHLFGEVWENDQWVSADEPLRVTNPDGIIIGFIAKEIFLHYSLPTSLKSENNIVNGFKLFNNYPNPFNPETNVKFSIPERNLVKIKIYNSLGEEIITLLNETLERGEHNVTWDGVNNNNKSVPSGVYFITMETQSFRKTIKSILIK